MVRYSAEMKGVNMKDYSSFVKHPKGFIISYEIKDGIIYIHTNETLKTGVPQEIPATKANIQYYENRLEKQYRLLIDYQTSIIDNKIGKFLLIAIALSLMLNVLSALLFSVSHVASAIVFVFALLTLESAILSDYLATKKFKDEIKIYEEFLKERKNIEITSQTDINITKNLSEKTKTNIQRNIDLKEQKMINNIFNINFMDSASLKDLKEMLIRYKIHKSLQEDIEFQIPNQQTEVKNSVKKKSYKPPRNQKK